MSRLTIVQKDNLSSYRKYGNKQLGLVGSDKAMDLTFGRRRMGQAE
jgi:hypothetical protein